MDPIQQNPGLFAKSGQRTVSPLYLWPMCDKRQFFV